MPVICVNPSNSSDKEIVDGLSKQNEDLRLFLSDKLEDSFMSSLPGKKAIGDILDDTHISTASSGAFCGVFFEDKDTKLRSIFINAIEDSSLKRIIWLSQSDPDEKILNLKNLAYLQHEDYKNLIENVLELESQEEIDFGHKEISKD
ncbi:hypothetical protein OA408_03340 [Acidimicrobiaceae bacterium]|nr:hypothetical protein [Acidimicrobiaceae bacterium]